MAAPLKGKLIVTQGYNQRYPKYVTDKYPNIDPYHDGIDLKAGVGRQVFAVKDGKVATADKVNDVDGLGIGINHGGGEVTYYWHLSKVLVRKGQVVKEGQLIGLVGSTGYTTGPHLHFSRYLLGVRVDPSIYLKEVEVTKEEARIKSISDCYRAITNKWPTKLVIDRCLKSGMSVPAYMRKTFFLRKLENVAKQTAAEHQVAIDKHLKTIEELKDECKTARDHAVERNEELKACEKKLLKPKKDLYQPIDFNIDWPEQLFNFVKTWLKKRLAGRK